ncbi:hypothetical protein [Sulfitobacter sp. R18_1]|uniref:hypothetical protein n=1 Tax=Sulfitobacter sp. R18_1 TaxID=2821104 RepID=UPI001ADBBC58|nr:hypothetical protein [Sulfitobacter sp. R18_1]MBO9428307.1 hypothetical protein [Sulfitobacter sp. R18_1]
MKPDTLTPEFLLQFYNEVQDRSDDYGLDVVDIERAARDRMPDPDDELAALDAKMEARGMIPLSKMLKSHGEMEKWMKHAGVGSFDDFTHWVAMKQREYMTLRMRYEVGDKDKSDDIYEWVFAHAAAFDAVATELRGIAPPEPTLDDEVGGPAPGGM